jgi:hypothetical protein
MIESFFSSFVVGENFISFSAEDVKKNRLSGYFPFLEIELWTYSLNKGLKKVFFFSTLPLRVANSS